MNNKATILVVDDTETNIDILLSLLGDEYDILVALDGKSALDIVQDEDNIDLILLDIMMPNMDGYSVCKVLKSRENSKDIPVIFITAKIDENSIERAYDAGGIDYITKPLKPRELKARVKTQLELRSVIKHLKFIASRDALTGVYNRREFFYLASKKFDHKYENLYAVMIDIDQFKKINDMYGHSVGDEVIKLVANTINDCMIEGSIFGRIGGEEFAIVCEAPTRSSIVRKIELIRKSIESLELFSDSAQRVTFTISEGIAKIKIDTESLDDLLKEADKALYEAKGSGRNKVIFR